MKLYKITFLAEVNGEITISAETENHAKDILESAVIDFEFVEQNHKNRTIGVSELSNASVELNYISKVE